MPPASRATRKRLSRRQSIGLVFACTLLGAGGQILIKLGVGSLAPSTGPIGMVLAMVTNVQVFAGFVLYALMTGLFVVALRDEELSVLYPIIALTYVWVTALSVWYFHEVFNFVKAAGIATIVTGVSVLGRNSKK